MDCSLLGSSVHGILQVRILDWVAMLSPEALPDPRIEAVYTICDCLETVLFLRKFIYFLIGR